MEVKVESAVLNNMADEEEKVPTIPSKSTPASQQERKTRPENPRSSTDPSPAELLQGWLKDKEKQEWSFRMSSSHQRNRSPYSRSHLRSRSSGSALLSAPPMARAHSLPNPQIFRSHDQSSTTSQSPGSLSPNTYQSHSPIRPRSPFRAHDEMSHPPRSPSWFESSAPSSTLIEAIQEDSELDFTPRGQLSQTQISQPSPIPHSSSSRSLPSMRRRPASPLHGLANTPAQAQPSFPASVIDQNAPLNMNPASSGSNSPTLGPSPRISSYMFWHTRFHVSEKVPSAT